MISSFLAAAFLITPLGCLMLLFLILWKPKQNRQYVFFIGLLFGLIGYTMEPVREIDISRYFMELDSIRDLPLSEAFNWNDDGLVVKNLAFWLIAKTNDNHVLPFVSMFIVYYCVALLISKGIKKDAWVFGVLLLLELLILPLYNIFSNVRNVVAFALASVAVYRDLCERKRTIATALLYIIPCFIHVSGIVIFLLRLVIPFISRLSHVGVWIMLCIPTFVASVFPYLRDIQMPGYMGIIMERLFWKSYAGMERSSEYSQTMLESGTFLMLRLIFIGFAIVLYLIVLQYQKKVTQKDERDYALYVEELLICSVVLATLGVVKYWVFAFALFLAPTPIYAYCIKQAKKKNHGAVLCSILLFATAGMNYLMQLRTMYYNIQCSKFFVDFILTDYIMVSFRVLRGILSI